MILFAVAFRFYFMPQLRVEWSKGKSKPSLLADHRRGDEATQLAELETVDEYLAHFLTWLMHLSTPNGLPKFTGGMVDVNTFALQQDGVWRLKRSGLLDRRSEFKEDDFQKVIVNIDGLHPPGLRTLRNRAETPVQDHEAVGTGVVLRAIYDACAIA